MSPRSITILYTALLALALALRLFFVAVIPPDAPSVAFRIESLNDEPSHFNYVRYLARHRSLPVQTSHAREPGATERGEFEYWQPPLYYILGAGLYAIAGDRAGFYLCRLLSFACGVLTLVVLARALALLDWPVSARRLAVGFVALLPPNVYFTSVVSNDALFWLIALLLTYELLLPLPGPGREGRPPGPWSYIRVAGLFAAGMLTKSGLGVFYPMALVTYAYLARRTGRVSVLVAGSSALGLSLLFIAPWYARNLAVYGSLFAMAVGFGPPQPEQATLAGIYHTIGGTIRFFWFPMSHIESLPVVRAIRSWGGILALAHTAAALWYVSRRRLDPRGWMLALLLALMLAAHFRLNWTWGQSEARFLYPALAAIAFFFVQPVHAWLGRFRTGEAIAWAWVTAAVLHPWVLLVYALPVPPS